MKTKKIFIAGHRGMVGSAVLKKLKSLGFSNIITRTRAQLDLRDGRGVKHFFCSEKPDVVVLCAAKVGGILANDTYRGDFIYDNLMISSNIIKSAQLAKVKKLINLGSSCIYPKHSSIPIKEEYLLTGRLEKTNEPYAIAKIAALKLCESFYCQYGSNFYSLMPCNLYGPRDNFDLETSHVLPALINKIYCAKEKGASSVNVWGTGKPLREFLYVEDLADAVVKCLTAIEASDIYSQGISHLNCGSDCEVSIKELAETIKSEIEFSGSLEFDDSKPDGTLRKKMDNSRSIDLGIIPSTPLKKGISLTYSWFVKNRKHFC